MHNREHLAWSRKAQVRPPCVTQPRPGVSGSFGTADGQCEQDGSPGATNRHTGKHRGSGRRPPRAADRAQSILGTEERGARRENERKGKLEGSQTVFGSLNPGQSIIKLISLLHTKMPRGTVCSKKLHNRILKALTECLNLGT